MDKNKNRKYLSDITVSLSRGKFDGKNHKKEIVLFIISGLLICSIIILAVIMLCKEFIEDNYNDVTQFVLDIILIIVSSAGVYFIAFVLMRRNKKIRKEILLWIEDAVELRAYCTKLDAKQLLFVDIIKLQVEFNYDGRYYVRTSDSERRDFINWGRPLGYFTGVSKYVDKEVNILYSPKYDEVMIIKDN